MRLKELEPHQKMMNMNECNLFLWTWLHKFITKFACKVLLKFLVTTRSQTSNLLIVTPLKTKGTNVLGAECHRHGREVGK